MKIMSIFIILHVSSNFGDFVNYIYQFTFNWQAKNFIFDAFYLSDLIKYKLKSNIL